MKRARAGLAVPLLGVALVVLVALAWLLLVYPGQPGPGRARHPVRVTLEPGGKLGTLASRLARAGVVRHPTVWAIYMRLRGADERLRTGPVVLSRGIAPVEVLRRVAKGYGPGTVRVPIPEGFTRFDVASRIQAWGVCSRDAFVRVTATDELLQREGLQREGVTAPSLEGYLFPATYRLEQRTDAREVAKRMVDTWDRHITDLVQTERAGYERLQEELGWGVHEIVILASIVETEAATPEERPVIAGVFLNRLRSPEFEPRRLQADPTAAYGCRVAAAQASSCEGYEGGPVSHTMLRDADNPYNTYRHAGLPPGPIANPGEGALRAVLAPATHDYLYFVSRGDGRHHFSSTFEEHQQAVERYR